MYFLEAYGRAGFGDLGKWLFKRGLKPAFWGKNFEAFSFLAQFNSAASVCAGAMAQSLGCYNVAVFVFEDEFQLGFGQPGNLRFNVVLA